MAADLEDVQLTKENVIEFREWLGTLAAKALIDVGAVSFFIDEEGHVRMEAKRERVIRTNETGETV